MADQRISPFFRNAFTDITGGLVSHQLLGRCAAQEMQMMDCLEAYGLDRGIRKCKCFIEEFDECQTLKKQFMRFMVMRRERERQIKCGLIPKGKEWETPRVDSY